METYNLNVGDIMTTALVTVHQDDTLDKAEEAMRLAGVRHLPVVNSHGKLIGILSNRDLLGASHTRRTRRFVADIMTRSVRTVRPDTAAMEAAAILLAHKIGSLPVESEEGELIGLLTESDFVTLAEQLLAGRGPELEGREAR